MDFAEDESTYCKLLYRELRSPHSRWKLGLSWQLGLSIWQLGLSIWQLGLCLPPVARGNCNHNARSKNHQVVRPSQSTEFNSINHSEKTQPTNRSTSGKLGRCRTGEVEGNIVRSKICKI